MNFFDQQEKVRKKTGLLVFYFFLAVFLIILTVDALFLGLAIISGDYDIYEAVNPELPNGLPFSKPISSEKLIDLMVTIAVMISPIVIGVILLGTLFRLFTLRAGGVAVAKMVGATPMDLNTPYLDEKKFLNVVEEMSIASGVPIPKLYIMQDQYAINAFVAGLRPNDTVMVVTKGAIQKLNRDELQGVIAHEYGHIFNSDMQFSVKLIGILAGVLFIGQIGYFILRTLRMKSYGKKGNGVLMFFLLGLGLYIAGYIGLFFGRLIKAAISRQRELLADACSVQFTRNPIGLVGALKKIENASEGTHLNMLHAEDVSHICFCPSLSVLFTNLLDTHPPIEFRIESIDPQGLYRPDPDPETETSEEAAANNKITTQKVIPLLNTIGLQVGTAAVIDSIGNPTQAHIDLAVCLLKSIPETLLNTAHDLDKVCLLFYALFVSRSFSFYAENEKELKTIIGENDLQFVIQLSQKIRQLDPRAVLPLIDISLPAFKLNLLSTRQIIFDNMKKLSELDKHVDLFEFAVLAIMGKFLKDQSPQALSPKYSDFSEVLPALSLLLSFVIAAYHKDDKIQDQRFSKISSELSTKPLTRIPLEFNDIEKLLSALATLNLLTPPCKEKLLHACLNAVQDDQKITLNEAELIRGIAATLDCPIPPIMSTV